MKKISLNLFIILVTQPFINAQIGINTKTPNAYLDIQANTTIENLLNVTDATDNNILQSKQIGDLTIYKALMPDNKAGNSGEILVSMGPNIPPIWEITPIENASVLVLNAQIDTPYTENRPAINTQRMSFPTLNSSIPPEIGSWNGTIFTTAKQGIYTISAGLLKILSKSSSNSNNIFIQITENGITRSISTRGIEFTKNSIVYASNNIAYTTTLQAGSNISIYANTTGVIGGTDNPTWREQSGYINILYAPIDE